jgi:hypothetical protein
LPITRAITASPLRLIAMMMSRKFTTSAIAYAPTKGSGAHCATERQSRLARVLVP